MRRPDTGNMEVLHKYGSEAQKKQWLEPLMKGDPLRLRHDGTGRRLLRCHQYLHQRGARGREWVINGEKHYVSGAGDPRCKIMIVMVKTDPMPQAPAAIPDTGALQYTGFKNIRAMNVFAMDDAPHGHMHQSFTNVRVPKDNIILGAGRGFEISQGRLGPGRIHHCMRAIGAAENAAAVVPALGVACRLPASRWPDWAVISISSPRRGWISSRRAC